MIALSVIACLRSWARWGQGVSLGYPSLSPMFGERALKVPLYGSGHAPEDVLEMERIVCSLERSQRYLIIQRWQRHLSYRAIAQDLGISVWSLSKRLKEAEGEINRLYNSSACKTNTEMVYQPQAR